MSATEERVEYVAHRTESGHSAETSLPALVVVATLLWVSEYIERVRDELEPFCRVLRRIDIGVKFARQLAVGLLDFVTTGIARNPEDFVVVHQESSPRICET